MSKFADLASRVVETNNSRLNTGKYEDDDDDEVLFAELEDEIANDPSATIREQGLQLLNVERDRMKHMKNNHYGDYSEITDEKEVVHVTAREPKCIVHFYHDKFQRCEIMDKHLAKLAPKYPNTRIFRVFVENIPWLVEKLLIKVLPCVICFVNGIAKDRLVGFEDLGNTDSFNTAALELRLLQLGVLQKPKENDTHPIFSIQSLSKPVVRRENNDEVFDLDE